MISTISDGYKHPQFDEFCVRTLKARLFNECQQLRRKYLFLNPLKMHTSFPFRLLEHRAKKWQLLTGFVFLVFSQYEFDRSWRG
jgi:hypothetical protein